MSKQALIQRLSLQRKPPSFLIGFDGFTDDIVQPIHTRVSAQSYTCISTIKDFADRIQEASGKSCNIELITTRTQIGGNGPILAHALTSFECLPSLIGCFGDPAIEPLFLPLEKKCKYFFSLAPSGHTDALEFTDGKILLGKHTPLFTITPKLLQTRISEETWQHLLEESDVFASVNWTMIPNMSDIWKWLLQHHLPKITPRERLFFVDLADPAKRGDIELQTSLQLLTKLQKYYRVYLGLNEKESERIYRLTTKKETIPSSIQEIAATIQKHTQLDMIVIHTLRAACCSTHHENHFVTGPFCAHPYISTGGGDHFNAGFLFAIASHFSPEEALLHATATSGYYVRTGKSPNLTDIISFLHTWEENPEQLDYANLK